MLAGHLSIAKKKTELKQHYNGKDLKKEKKTYEI